MSRRRQGRELVLGCLYAYFSTGESVDQVFEGQARRASCDTVTGEWAKQLFRNAIDNAEAIDRAIRDNAEKWDFGRIGQVEKNILRLAIAELRFCLDTPPRVVINEALELAREFAGDDSRAFINGILDRVYKQELEGQNKESSNESDSNSEQNPRPRGSSLRHD